jgi:long-subunit acyl-CoA synthetase (AMP-forming)
MAFRGGAFRSGDLAVWYPDGSIVIMDRSKDIIISGGEVSVDVLKVMCVYFALLECIQFSY